MIDNDPEVTAERNEATRSELKKKQKQSTKGVLRLHRPDNDPEANADENTGIVNSLIKIKPITHVVPTN